MAEERRDRARRADPCGRRQPVLHRRVYRCSLTDQRDAHALLISTYEMGRQPFGLASPAAWLRAAGWEVDCVELAKERLTRERVASADLVGIPPADAHRDAAGGADHLAAARQANPSARICAYGLYAPLNGEWLQSLGVDAVFGGEFEEELAAFADHVRSTQNPLNTQSNVVKRVLRSPRPLGPIVAISRCPGFTFSSRIAPGCRRCRRYATLQLPDGGRRARRATPRRAAGAGICAAIARSCRSTKGSSASCSRTWCSPTSTPRSRPAPSTSRLAIPTSSTARRTRCGLSSALHAEHPSVSYDVTIKVEHLLQHRQLLPRLAATGCAVRHQRGRIGRRPRARAARQGAHARRLRRGRGALPRQRR